MDEEQKKPEAPTAIIENLSIGIGRMQPNYEDGNFRITIGTGRDAGRIGMTAGAKSYGDWHTIGLSIPAFQRLSKLIGDNAAYIRKQFMPTGILLSPFAGGAPVRIEGGSRVAIVGDRLVVFNFEGQELQSVDAADFSVDWIRAQG